MVRTAGAGAQIMARDGDFANVKMPSGEIRKLHVECYATVMGQVGNSEHQNQVPGQGGPQALAGHPPDRARRLP
jgi:large subunit ribosomal protein L2